MALPVPPDVLDAATTRLLATVEALPDAEWSGDTYCAGWSRAHVIAHLALNAEGLAGVLEGLRDGAPRPMYASSEGRDADIEELAGVEPAVIRARLRDAAERLSMAWSGAAVGDARFERTPGGPTIRAAAIGFMRLREVEIHHADLQAGYSWNEWPTATVEDFLDNSAQQYAGPGFHAVATDGAGRWTFGEPGPEAATVSGPAASLAWWATGRPLPDDQAGAVLSGAGEALPTMEGR